MTHTTRGNLKIHLRFTACLTYRWRGLLPNSAKTRFDACYDRAAMVRHARFPNAPIIVTHTLASLFLFSLRSVNFTVLWRVMNKVPHFHSRYNTSVGVYMGSIIYTKSRVLTNMRVHSQLDPFIIWGIQRGLDRELLRGVDHSIYLELASMSILLTPRAVCSRRIEVPVLYIALSCILVLFHSEAKWENTPRPRILLITRVESEWCWHNNLGPIYTLLYPLPISIGLSGAVWVHPSFRPLG